MSRIIPRILSECTEPEGDQRAAKFGRQGDDLRSRFVGLKSWGHSERVCQVGNYIYLTGAQRLSWIYINKVII